MSLGHLDLNLLRVLDTLLTERSVTRAGEVLGRSQPAVSNALSRLRQALGDELLVRASTGLVLTPRAEALREPLRRALAGLEASLFEAGPFDPATERGTLRLATPDRLSLAIVPRLFARLQTLAPKLGLHVATADRDHALHLIDADEVDLALGWIDSKPTHVRAEHLHDDMLECVFRADHPLARRAKPTMDAVLAYPHVVVSASGGRTAIFDDLIARQGLQRKATVTVSNFTAVSQLLQGSDMIGVFTSLASHVFETSYGLARRPVPLQIGSIATNMVWHMRYENERRHMWLREQIREVYRSL